MAIQMRLEVDILDPKSSISNLNRAKLTHYWRIGQRNEVQPLVQQAIPKLLPSMCPRVRVFMDKLAVPLQAVASIMVVVTYSGTFEQRKI